MQPKTRNARHQHRTPRARATHLGVEVLNHKCAHNRGVVCERGIRGDFITHDEARARIICRNPHEIRLPHQSAANVPGLRLDQWVIQRVDDFFNGVIGANNDHGRFAATGVLRVILLRIVVIAAAAAAVLSIAVPLPRGGSAALPRIFLRHLRVRVKYVRGSKSNCEQDSRKI